VLSLTATYIVTTTYCAIPSVVGVESGWRCIPDGIRAWLRNQETVFNMPIEIREAKLNELLVQIALSMRSIRYPGHLQHDMNIIAGILGE
jgi:hypothetical protein